MLVFRYSIRIQFSNISTFFFCIMRSEKCDDDDDKSVIIIIRAHIYSIYVNTY